MNNLLQTAIIVFIVGVLAMLIAPVLFTRPGFISFAHTGQIGDTIGGITAPITSLVGSVLVFLALRAQLMANQVTQIQIQEHKKELQSKKELMYVSELYKYFTSNIQHFETKYFKGHKAIMKVMNMLAKKEQEAAHNDEVLYYGIAAELYGVLRLGKLFLEQVNKSGLDIDDKVYFKQMVKHHYESFIIPYLTKNKAPIICEVCGEMHNGVPLKLVKLIQDTVALFQYV